MAEHDLLDASINVTNTVSDLDGGNHCLFVSAGHCLHCSLLAFIT